MRVEGIVDTSIKRVVFLGLRGLSRQSWWAKLLLVESHNDKVSEKEKENF